MEWLDKILQDIENREEIASKICAELPKNFIPKDKYNRVIDEKRELIEKQTGDTASAVKNAVISYALSTLSEKEDVKDAEILKMLIDRDGITVGDDGLINGLKEQIEAIKEERPYLFNPAKVSGKSPAGGDGMPMGVTKEQFEKMGYRERLELFNDNPDLYNHLTN